MSGTLHAEGPNYSVTIDGIVAIVRVWRRPDLSFEDGARSAVEVASHLTAIAEGKLEGVTGVVLDLREAPELVGKKTRDAIGFVLAKCEALGVRFAVVIGSPTQAVIIEHVTRDGPVRVARDYEDALAWSSVPRESKS